MDLEFYARYYLEHKALPNTLYDEGPGCSIALCWMAGKPCMVSTIG